MAGPKGIVMLGNVETAPGVNLMSDSAALLGTPAAALALSPIEPVGMVELVVRRLGEAIGTGALRPGERLPSEKELAPRLGVSVMTLRQALHALREAGYIETRRGRSGGNYVCMDADAVLRSYSGSAPVLSVEEIREFTDWRRAVSGESAYLAAERRTEDERARLWTRANDVELALDDFASFRLADARLHVAVAESSHSASLVAAETTIQGRLSEVLQAISGPPTADRASHKEHEVLLKAIDAGDSRLAREVMHRHIEGTFNWYVGLLIGRLKHEDDSAPI